MCKCAMHVRLFMCVIIACANFWPHTVSIIYGDIRVRFQWHTCRPIASIHRRVQRSSAAPVIPAGTTWAHLYNSIRNNTSNDREHTTTHKTSNCARLVAQLSADNAVQSCDWQDIELSLHRCTFTVQLLARSPLRKNLRHVSHTLLPLSPSSINWYQIKLVAEQATHYPRVWGLASLAGVWLRNGDQCHSMVTCGSGRSLAF